jgi:hypothetical protein
MTDTTTNCECFTLQSANTQPVVVGHNPVVMLGLLSMFMLIVTVLVLAIVIKPKAPRIPDHQLPNPHRSHQEQIMDIDSDAAH